MGYFGNYHSKVFLIISNFFGPTVKPVKHVVQCHNGEIS